MSPDVAGLQASTRLPTAPTAPTGAAGAVASGGTAVPTFSSHSADQVAAAFETELRMGLQAGDAQRAYEAATSLWRRTRDLGRCHRNVATVLAAAGTAWATGQETVRAGHRITAAASTLLIRLRALTAEPAGPATTLLAVPPGDGHTLALISLAHLLEDAGHGVEVVGDLPVDELVAAARDAAAVVLSVHTQGRELQPLLNAMRSANRDALLVIGGPAAPGAGSGADLVTDEISALVAALAAASCPLTERELEVLGCVADGLTNPEAARRLGISPATFKTHLDRVFEKTGTTRRGSAVAIALRHAWIA